MPALGVHEGRLPVDVSRAPRGECPHYHPELAALVGQDVLGPRRMLGVEAPRHQRMLLHELEAIGEDVGRNTGQALLEVLDPARAAAEIPGQEEVPGIAYHYIRILVR